MTGIYKITSPSNRVYIGQSRDIASRKRQYRSLNGGKRQPTLFNSFQKYGYNNHLFEVVYELPKDVDQSSLDNYEKFYISQLKEANISLLNIKDGGIFGSTQKESTRNKIRVAVRGNKNMLGKKHSAETKEKISKSKKGKSVAWNKGKKWPQFVLDKMNKFPKGNIPHNKGKIHNVHTEDVREKMSKANKARWDFAKKSGIRYNMANGERQHSAKLNYEKVLRIRNDLAGDTSMRSIANKYGVCPTTIRNIKDNKIWRHVK